LSAFVEAAAAQEREETQRKKTAHHTESDLEKLDEAQGLE
jgi:hypothetical protein